jgi:hypothetical protein
MVDWSHQSEQMLLTFECAGNGVINSFTPILMVLNKIEEQSNTLREKQMLNDHIFKYNLGIIFSYSIIKKYEQSFQRFTCRCWCKVAWRRSREYSYYFSNSLGRVRTMSIVVSTCMTRI